MNKLQETPRIYGNVWGITVDGQNDFALPTGALSVKDGEAIVQPSNEFNQFVRDHSGNVIFTADWHPAETAHFQKYGGIWPEHCVADTEGAQLHSGLIVMPEDTFAIKGTGTKDDGYSGMEAVPQSGALYRPELAEAGFTLQDALLEAEEEMRQRKQRLVVGIGGLATDFCVKATVLDALKATDRRVTDVVLLRDAIRAVNLEPDAGDKAIAAMIEAGALAMSTRELIRGGIVIDRSRLER